MLWEERILEITYLEIQTRESCWKRSALSFFLLYSNSKREIRRSNRCQKKKKRKEKIVAKESSRFRIDFLFFLKIGGSGLTRRIPRGEIRLQSFRISFLNCPLSFFFLSSWFSVASTRRRWARIGTAATSVAGSATSLWPGNATCWGTSTLTASSATRACSRMGARSATKSSVSIPRYDTLRLSFRNVHFFFFFSSLISSVTSYR